MRVSHEPFPSKPEPPGWQTSIDDHKRKYNCVCARATRVYFRTAALPFVFSCKPGQEIWAIHKFCFVVEAKNWPTPYQVRTLTSEPWERHHSSSCERAHTLESCSCSVQVASIPHPTPLSRIKQTLMSWTHVFCSVCFPDHEQCTQVFIHPICQTLVLENVYLFKIS